MRPVVEADLNSHRRIAARIENFERVDENNFGHGELRIFNPRPALTRCVDVVVTQIKHQAVAPPGRRRGRSSLAAFTPLPI